MQYRRLACVSFPRIQYLDLLKFSSLHRFSSSTSSSNNARRSTTNSLAGTELCLAHHNTRSQFVCIDASNIPTICRTSTSTYSTSYIHNIKPHSSETHAKHTHYISITNHPSTSHFTNTSRISIPPHPPKPRPLTASSSITAPPLPKKGALR